MFFKNLFFIFHCLQELTVFHALQLLLFVFLSRFSIVFICFSKAFPKGEKVNLACSITLFRLEGNFSSPVRYPYWSMLPDDNSDIFAAFLLILYYILSSLILSSIFMISFCIFSRRFFVKRDEFTHEQVK